MNKKGISRKKKDNIMKSVVYAISSFAILIFVAILFYIVTTGGNLISWDLITGDYENINTDVYVKEVATTFTKPGDIESGEYFSTSWGIVFKDDKNKEGHSIVVVEYVDIDSPFKNAIDKNSETEKFIELKKGITIQTAFLYDSDGKMLVAQSKYGAKNVQEIFDTAQSIDSVTIQKTGGGIRGSIITTLYLIILTLLIAIPFGVFTAIYLNEYAKRNKLNKLLRTLIETLTGIPSIIYGLMGAAVFIPFANGVFGTGGGSIISGAFTMAIILLPVIIKSTEEALKIIPNDVRNASLALGASKTQTTFKVVLPSATPGILTGVLLGVGRIIGESAALIYAIGAVIKDDISITGRSSTLSVHIWTVMGGEEPNFELASAIALIILFVVIILSILVKIIARKFNKSWY